MTVLSWKAPKVCVTFSTASGQNSFTENGSDFTKSLASWSSGVRNTEVLSATFALKNLNSASLVR